MDQTGPVRAGQIYLFPMPPLLSYDTYYCVLGPEVHFWKQLSWMPHMGRLFIDLFII